MSWDATDAARERYEMRPRKTAEEHEAEQAREEMLADWDAAIDEDSERTLEAEVEEDDDEDPAKDLSVPGFSQADWDAETASGSTDEDTDEDERCLVCDPENMGYECRCGTCARCGNVEAESATVCAKCGLEF